MLEVGTGWGELAIQAARRGAKVVTITISREQQALAARRVAEAGLADQVSVELRDYRDVDGEFDAICSVEMLEAVGERYWDAYFAALDAHLAPGGRIGLQTITMPHDRMLATRHTYTWIQKYIFPGGLLPSVTAIENSLTGATRLRITGREDFGAHYAETLRIWRERFRARADEVAGLGFDEVFNRMWNFYLCYSEAGFRAGYIGVSQLTLARILTSAKPAGKQQSTPAEIIAALLNDPRRPRPAGRLRAWDGSEAGPQDSPGRWWSGLPGHCGASLAARRARPGPRLHQRRPRHRGRPHRRPAPRLGRLAGQC